MRRQVTNGSWNKIVYGVSTKYLQKAEAEERLAVKPHFKVLHIVRLLAITQNDGH